MISLCGTQNHVSVRRAAEIADWSQVSVAEPEIALTRINSTDRLIPVMSLLDDHACAPGKVRHLLRDAAHQHVLRGAQTPVANEDHLNVILMGLVDNVLGGIALSNEELTVLDVAFLQQPFRLGHDLLVKHRDPAPGKLRLFLFDPVGAGELRQMLRDLITRYDMNHEQLALQSLSIRDGQIERFPSVVRAVDGGEYAFHCYALSSVLAPHQRRLLMSR